MSLRRRLERLEAARGDRCPECRFSEASENPSITVEWEPLPTEEEISDLRAWYEAFQSSAPALGNRTGAATEEEPEDPNFNPIAHDEYCPRCGRQTLYIVDWDDAPSPRELRRLEAEMLARRGWTLPTGEPGVEEGPALKLVPDYAPRSWGGGGGR